MALFCCLVTTYLTSFPSVNLQVDLPDLNRNVERDQSKLTGKTDLWEFLGCKWEAIYSVNYIIPSVLDLLFSFTGMVMLPWPHTGSTYSSSITFWYIL